MMTLAGALTAQSVTDRFFDEYYFPFNPSGATSNGIHQYDDKLEDYSKDGVAARVAILKKFEAEFAKEPPTADRDLVLPLHKRLEKLFATILLNTTVKSLKDEKTGIRVTLEGPNVKEKEQVFDRVLMSVGRRPNSEIPGLDRTKVKVNQKGFIEINEQRQTADPTIYAIGDVAGEPMLAHKAMHEGRTAVEAIAGHKVAFEPNAIPAVVFTDPEIAWAGLTETQAKEQGREITVAKFPWAASGRAITIDRPEGLTKLLIDPKTERVLGVGIVGAGAGELIAEGVLAIEMCALAADVGMTIHPHPTLSETMMESAEVFYGQATDIYRPKR